MQVSTRFSLAVHTLLCINHFDGKEKVTSNFIGTSTNTNPKTIRQIFGQLKEAGLIEVKAGIGGASVAKPMNEITLLDVFNAVDSLEHGRLFDFHKDPSQDCPVGKQIHSVLDPELADAQAALEARLAATTLQDLADNLM